MSGIGLILFIMSKTKVVATKHTAAGDQSAVIVDLQKANAKLSESNEILTKANGVLTADNVKLKEDLDKSNTDVVSLRGANDSLKSDKDRLESLLQEKKNELSDLQTEKGVLTDRVKELETALDTEVASKGVDSVVVNHGVVVGGKTYSKSEVEASKDIQEYLVSIGSSAVTVVE